MASSWTVPKSSGGGPSRSRSTMPKRLATRSVSASRSPSALMGEPLRWALIASRNSRIVGSSARSEPINRSTSSVPRMYWLAITAKPPITTYGMWAALAAVMTPRRSGASGGGTPTLGLPGGTTQLGSGARQARSPIEPLGDGEPPRAGRVLRVPLAVDRPPAGIPFSQKRTTGHRVHAPHCTPTPLELLRPVGAHAGDGQSLGNRPRDLADLLVGDRVEGGDRRVGVDVLAEHDRLVGGVAGHRARVLERQHQPAGRVGAGPLDLLLGRPVPAQLIDDPPHPRVGLDALLRLQPRPELEDGDVGKGMCQGVDRVAQAPLLADLL